MELRDYRPDDAAHIDRIAVAAFSELRSHYDDWESLSANLGRMSSLADRSEIVVAAQGEAVIGAVAYVGPGVEKADYFDRDWPVMRTLVVDPARRGLGAGRALTEACIDRARRDGASLIALHTSPIMSVALPMYLRMGFEKLKDVPAIYGVPYAVYVKRLAG